MRKINGMLLALVVAITAAAQQPTGFSYQAVLRNSSGQVLANQSVMVKLSITSSDGSTTYYAESHSTSTNQFGLVNLVVGGGTVLSGNLAVVPWGTGQQSLKVEVSTNGGTTFGDLGSQPIHAVPLTTYSDSARVSYQSAHSATSQYAESAAQAVYSDSARASYISYQSAVSHYADSAARAGYADSINLSFTKNLVVVGKEPSNPDDPIFEVKNSQGEVLFGVYQEGVRINIPDSAITKGAKGGFAVGGLTNQTKGAPVEYLRITPDSARVYVKQKAWKGAKGGFAVGGLTNQTKTVVAQDLLFVNPDSARIYINENPVKGAKGGFAVGGLTNGKSIAQLIQLTKDNYLIGYEAGASMSSGIYNSFLGYQAGKNNSTGNLNTFLGYQAGLNNQGSDNTFIGYQAGMMHTSKGGNVYIGSKAGANALNGERNVLIGESAGYSLSSGVKNVFIGYETGYSTSTGYNNVFLGTRTGYANTTGKSNVYIGDSTAVNNTYGSKNVFLGNYAGLNNTGGDNNVYIGFEAGYSGQWASQNICIGNYSGYSNTTGQNLFIGEYAGEKNTTGTRNSFVGFFAGQNNLTGGQNSYFGQFAGMDNTKSYNTFIGYWAGGNNVDGEKNAFLGYRSGQGSNGSNNVFLGYQAGEGNTGSNNVLIGYQAGYYTGNVSNVLYIANSSSSPPLIYGNFSTGYVGLGTVSPDKKLHVVGDARVTGSIYYGTGTSTYTKPDFVFNPDYNEFYDPLSVERFIRVNGHLPWLTKASDEKDGVNLTRMQFETVETVENLQLQIIQQQKEIESLKAEVEALKKLIKQ
jgi:hypothetical protein